MPAKRRGKAVTIRSSPAFSFATSQRPKPASRVLSSCHARQRRYDAVRLKYVGLVAMHELLHAHAGDVPGPGTYNIHGDAQFPLDAKERHMVKRSISTCMAQSWLATLPYSLGGLSAGSQIDARGNVLTKRGTQPLGSMRTSPAYSLASKPFSSAMLSKTPGPGDYKCGNAHDINDLHCGVTVDYLITMALAVSLHIHRSACCQHDLTAAAHDASMRQYVCCSDHKCFPGPKAPAYTFAGAEVSDPNAKFPGPGQYKWPDADARVRPNSPAVTMKFRRGKPEDKTRRPAPNEYNPRDPLQIYKGEFTRVTIKLRCETNYQSGCRHSEPSFRYTKQLPLNFCCCIRPCLCDDTSKVSLWNDAWYPCFMSAAD